MNNYLKTLIYHISQLNNTSITDRHLKILEYVHDFYVRYKYRPLYHNIKQNTGATVDDLNSLFPHGLNSIYSWLGIPVKSSEGPCKPFVPVDIESRREVFLDHNATTYLSREVINLLNQHYRDPSNYGNASSSTELGRKAYTIIFNARMQIAECLKVNPDEIIFTSGGSEANNLAIKGIAFDNFNKKGHIVTDAIEHSSVLEAVRYLEKIGFSATYVDVDKDGIVDPDRIKSAMRDDTILVSVMAVNNEIGTINPVKEIGAVCAERGIPFMVDAVQGFGKIPLLPREMGISLLSISGHKIYAPKGIGALYIDNRIKLTPLIHGGAQEYNLRAGTENTPYIKALGISAEIVMSGMQRENARLLELRDYFLNELRKIDPSCIVNGSLEKRVPHNLNIGFHGIDSGALLLSLNEIGVYVSAGSACSSGSHEASHVIKALGVDTDKYGTIRFSFGLRTSAADIDYVLQYLPAILEQIRNTKFTKKGAF